MSALTRTRVGVCQIENAHKLSEIEEYVKNNKVSEFITPTDDMFPDYQSVCLSGVEEMLAKNGNMFKTEKTQEGTIKVYLSDGRFAGVFAYDSVAECYRPEKMFLSEN